MGESLFVKHSQDEHAQSLADYLPGGDFFQAKNIDGTNFRKLLEGFAVELQREESLLADTSIEHDINCAEEAFLDRWESALGIPDECFPGTGDFEERRTHAIAKLALSNVATREDFITLASFLGVTVTIASASEFFDLGLPYDLPFFLFGSPDVKWIWVVSGENIANPGLPYALPFELLTAQTVLQCVFESLKPAMTELFFVNT